MIAAAGASPCAPMCRRLAPLIWLGGLVMALGGVLSLWGRLRVKETEPKPAAPAAALAAE